MKLFHWGIAQGETLEEVAEQITEMLPDDEDESGRTVTKVGVRLTLAGASTEEKEAIMERVRQSRR